MLSRHTYPVVFAGSISVFPSIFLPCGNKGKLTLTVAVDYRTERGNAELSGHYSDDTTTDPALGRDTDLGRELTGSIEVRATNGDAALVADQLRDIGHRQNRAAAYRGDSHGLE